MKIALFAILMTFMNFGFAQHDHDLSNAKLAHDTSHRIGKLVDQGRLDESFLLNMSSLEVVSLPHTDHNGPAFKVISSVGSGATQLEVVFNMSGKYLSNKIVAQGPAEVSPWGETVAAELIEAALHPLLETTAADMKPFVNDLSKVSIKRATKEDGSIEAVVLVSSSKTSKTLQVTLTPEGVILSTTVLQ